MTLNGRKRSGSIAPWRRKHSCSWSSIGSSWSRTWSRVTRSLESGGCGGTISVVEEALEHLAAGIERATGKIFLDPQELVVLRDAVGTAERAGLDLSGVGGHGQVGDEDVLGFARTVRDDIG